MSTLAWVQAVFTDSYAFAVLETSVIWFPFLMTYSSYYVPAFLIS